MASTLRTSITLPPRRGVLMNAAPGSPVSISGVLDGHAPDQIWVAVGHVNAAAPVLLGDFTHVAWLVKLSDASDVRLHLSAGVILYTATLLGIYATTAAPGDSGWVALAVAAAGDEPTGATTLLVVDGPFEVVAAYS